MRSYFWCATFLLPEKPLVLHLLLMNTFVPSAIALVHNMVMVTWIMTCGKGEQILNAVRLLAVMRLLK
jgi:hypothetical protein